MTGWDLCNRSGFATAVLSDSIRFDSPRRLVALRFRPPPPPLPPPLPPPNAATAAAAAAAAALLPAAADARVANVRFCLCRRRLAAEFCHFIVVLPFWERK